MICQVDSSGVQILIFLIKALFRCSDIVDASKPLIKVISFFGLLEVLVIHGKALDEIFFQNRIRPDKKLASPWISHSESNGKNRIQIIFFDLTLLSVRGSCQVILDN